MPSKSSSETDCYTVAKFSQVAGFGRHTLATRIHELGIEPAGKSSRQNADTYRLRDLIRAILGGDIEAERLRKTREEADRLALQNARSRGETIEVDRVKKLGQCVFIAIRQRILNFPLSQDEQDALLTDLLKLKEINWDLEAGRVEPDEQ